MGKNHKGAAPDNFILVGNFTIFSPTKSILAGLEFTDDSFCRRQPSALYG